FVPARFPLLDRVDEAHGADRSEIDRDHLADRPEIDGRAARDVAVGRQRGARSVAANHVAKQARFRLAPVTPFLVGRLALLRALFDEHCRFYPVASADTLEERRLRRRVSRWLKGR